MRIVVREATYSLDKNEMGLENYWPVQIQVKIWILLRLCQLPTCIIADNTSTGYMQECRWILWSLKTSFDQTGQDGCEGTKNDRSTTTIVCGIRAVHAHLVCKQYDRSSRHWSRCRLCEPDPRPVLRRPKSLQRCLGLDESDEAIPLVARLLDAGGHGPTV